MVPIFVIMNTQTIFFISQSIIQCILKLILNVEKGIWKIWNNGVCFVLFLCLNNPRQTMTNAFTAFVFKRRQMTTETTVGQTTVGQATIGQFRRSSLIAMTNAFTTTVGRATVGRQPSPNVLQLKWPIRVSSISVS